jgi:hypothetical protein
LDYAKYNSKSVGSILRPATSHNPSTDFAGASASSSGPPFKSFAVFITADHGYVKSIGCARKHAGNSETTTSLLASGIALESCRIGGAPKSTLAGGGESADHHGGQLSSAFRTPGLGVKLRSGMDSGPDRQGIFSGLRSENMIFSDVSRISVASRMTEPLNPFSAPDILAPNVNNRAGS